MMPNFSQLSKKSTRGGKVKELQDSTHLWPGNPAISQGKNIDKPSIWRVRPFETQKLIDRIETLSPGTGRVKVLAILHCFSDKKLWIPNSTAAKRLVRNQNLFRKWRQGTSYSDLSQEFKIKERWIRAIITIMLHYQKKPRIQELLIYAAFTEDVRIKRLFCAKKSLFFARKSSLWR